MSKNIPEITESSKFNFITSIWIVPFIAMMIAGWLAYEYFENRGPEIKIIFPKNEGLTAGQSLVKFRNVPIGKVTKIYLDESVDGVVVVIRMNSKDATPYMNNDTKFWIVKPEVGLTGVSGLDTLISGTYIDVYAKKGKEFKEMHFGLTQPYHDSSKGEYFHLTSINGNNISVGTPIYYKNIKVGQVEYLYLSLERKGVDFLIFIDKEYASYVHRDSRFWTKNMLNIDLTKGKLDLNIAPMNFLLAGGIVFSSSGEKKNHRIENDYIFRLYKSKTEAEANNIGASVKTNKKFLLLTEESIASLSVDSLVRFDGFDIGKVLEIKLSYSQKMHKMFGQILIELDTSVFVDKHDVNSSGVKNFYEAVEEGLRARIAALDPITGAQFVDLTFHHDDGKGKIKQGKYYARIPMASSQKGSIVESVTQILDKLNHLPLEKLLASVTSVIESAAKPVENANNLLLDLKKTVEHINKLTSKKSFEVMPDELNIALKEMTRTLKATRKVVKGYDSDSLVKEQLTQTLEVVTKTSKEMQLFLRMLNRKPNSLIFGDN